MEGSVLEVLLQQSPLIVFMGVVIYWLQKRLTRSEDEKNELSKLVNKVALQWDDKFSKDNEKITKILDLLLELKMTQNGK